MKRPYQPYQPYRLTTRGSLVTRFLPSGQVLDVWPELLAVRLTITASLESECCQNSWLYRDLDAALSALMRWVEGEEVSLVQPCSAERVVGLISPVRNEASRYE